MLIKIATLPLLLADAALPLMWFTIPAVILMLIPTVLVEGFLLKLWLRIPTGRALKASSLANAASTIAGVPLATLLSFLANLALNPWTQRVLEREHWQSPLGDILMAVANSYYISAYVAEARWILPAALLIILVPAFLISWLVEYWIVRWVVSKGPNQPAENSRVNRAVRRANYASYAILFIVAATLLIRSQFRGLFF